MILMDEFMVSGETLVRDLQMGTARAAELGGAMPVGYLPDMFGHVAQMPQILRLAGLEVLFNVAKLFALIALGFWFLTWFETVAWAVLIAAIIPWVDIWSVFFGPTGKITEDHFSVFEEVSIAFRVPGQDGYANLGPPDILFFALFLAAAARFGLRVGATWVAMTALLGLTLVLTATTDVGGLPALPAICLGFLAANADVLWRQLRPRRELRSD